MNIIFLPLFSSITCGFFGRLIGYEGAKIGGTWGLVGRAVPLGLKLGLKTVGKTFDLGTRVANTTVFNPMSKLLSGQVPFTGGKIPYTKITVPVIKYSDKLVP